MADASPSKYGMIAGNGRFPLLALETARREGHEVVVVAIENEATPELARFASSLHWISIGQLSRLIDILKRENVSEVMMTGQVKHVSIFSSITPDWRLAKLLTSLKEKNTAALIGGIQSPSRRRDRARRFHPAAERSLGRRRRPYAPQA